MKETNTSVLNSTWLQNKGINWLTILAGNLQLKTSIGNPAPFILKGFREPTNRR